MPGRRLKLLLIVLLWATGAVQAQGFHVRASLPASVRGSVSMIIYDNGSRPRTLKARIDNRMAEFSGTVAGEAYAELCHPDFVTPVAFFIENADINITVNAENPDASPITGSRSNSHIRYLLEQCDGDVQCLAEFVKGNHASVLSPYIIARYLSPNMETDAVASLYELLDSGATRTYHYKLLTDRMERLRVLSIGSKLPEFSFVDNDGKTKKLSEVMSDSLYHALLFGATWCEQCTAARNKLEGQFDSLQVITIDIDRDKKQWDAPYMKQLEIDHIPYIILLDPEGKIMARDARVWEVGRILQNAIKEK